MTTRRIHTNTKIFFPDPYVVRLEYPDDTVESATVDFMKVRRRAYKNITGTWGHSILQVELVEQPTDENLSPPSPLTFYLHDNKKFVPRAYFCFKDELDVLQFKLSVDARAIQVHMWPSLKFTIHEYIEESEGDPNDSFLFVHKE
jgi:hypothetical protein